MCASSIRPAFGECEAKNIDLETHLGELPKEGGRTRGFGFIIPEILRQSPARMLNYLILEVEQPDGE
jgi:hypothetical protein